MGDIQGNCNDVSEGSWTMCLYKNVGRFLSRCCCQRVILLPTDRFPARLVLKIVSHATYVWIFSTSDSIISDVLTLLKVRNSVFSRPHFWLSASFHSSCDWLLIIDWLREVTWHLRILKRGRFSGKRPNLASFALGLSPEVMWSLILERGRKLASRG